MRCFMRVHLVDGSVVDGVSEEVTQQELDDGKPAISDILMGSGGWQINAELPNGSWACFPKASVLYIEVVKV